MQHVPADNLDLLDQRVIPEKRGVADEGYCMSFKALMSISSSGRLLISST